ncbi:MAG: dockerin type I repeat-containing protein [Ruminococcus sp.]|nr:dockerin type I repeat-containing protein [Ruminococcus sp.]
MKKLISLLLVAVLLITCVASASAISSTNPDYLFCRQAYIDYKMDLDGRCDAEYLICSVYATTDELYVFRAYGDVPSPDASCHMRIGDYLLTCDSIIGDESENCVGIYVADKKGDVIFLKEAVENGLFDIADYAKLLPDCYLIGDADMDSELTIKDATAIQKYIAKIEGEHILVPKSSKWAVDMNGDYEINVKDATAVQKYIAGLEIEVNDSIV